MMNRTLFALVVFASSLAAAGTTEKECIDEIFKYPVVQADADGTIDVEGFEMQLELQTHLLRTDCSKALDVVAVYMAEFRLAARKSIHRLEDIGTVLIEDCPLPSSKRHKSRVRLEGDGTLSLCISYPEYMPSRAPEWLKPSLTSGIESELEKFFVPDSRPVVGGHSNDVIGDIPDLRGMRGIK